MSTFIISVDCHKRFMLRRSCRRRTSLPALEDPTNLISVGRPAISSCLRDWKVLQSMAFLCMQALAEVCFPVEGGPQAPLMWSKKIPSHYASLPRNSPHLYYKKYYAHLVPRRPGNPNSTCSPILVERILPALSSVCH